MAKHIIILTLDDDYGDIEDETDLENFVQALKDSTHADLTAKWVYNYGPSEVEE